MKKYLRLCGVLLLCVVLVKIDLSGLASVLFKVSVPVLVVVVLLNFPHLFIKSFRWKQLLKMQSIDYDMKNSFLAYWSGVFAGIITPGKLGEFVRVAYLKTDLGIPFSQGFASVLVDRLFDIYLLTILGCIGIWKFCIPTGLSTISLVLSVVVMLLPLLSLKKHWAEKLLAGVFEYIAHSRFRDLIEKNFGQFYSAIEPLIGFRIIPLVGLTCIGYVIFFFQAYLVVVGLGVPLDFMTITFYVAIANMISLVPISISGLGTRDVTLIYLFSLNGLKPELAVGYSLLVFFVFNICSGILGAAAWWIKPVAVGSFSKKVEFN